MKARSKELLDRAIAATVAAIEIYNKPDFLYREEAFAVLAVNGWELLLKAKWLHDHNNRIRSLYVLEPMTRKSGKRGKKLCVKTTRSGNPFTHSLDFLAQKLVEQAALNPKAWANPQALISPRQPSRALRALGTYSRCRPQTATAVSGGPGPGRISARDR